MVLTLLLEACKMNACMVSAFKLEAHRSPRPPRFDDVRKVILIVSASRSGSSAVAEWLRAQPGLLHLGGELKPILRLAGVSDSSGDDGSDVLNELPHSIMPAFEREFFKRLGTVPEASADIRPRELVDNVLLSFRCQWPEIAFDGEQIQTWVVESLGRLGWNKVGDFDSVEFTTELLRHVVEKHPSICPYRYDLPSWKVGCHFPDRTIPAGPLPGRLIEETPFVLPRMWRQVHAGDLQNRTVVIKDPSNIYRMGLIRRVFAKAEIRVIHLVRNPAASINGLLDGWEHRNFFSHRTCKPLNIRGYSDRFSWASHWWKFDLPLGWQAFRNASLGEVCAFQWAATNKRIIEETAGLGRAAKKLKFEDFIEKGLRGCEVRQDLLNWLGIRNSDAAFLDCPRPVMVTNRPAPYRWRSRESLIMEFVKNASELLCPEELGYERVIDAWR
jgi:hypothetical protein